jgi:hypothetical protein
MLFLVKTIGMIVLFIILRKGMCNFFLAAQVIGKVLSLENCKKRNILGKSPLLRANKGIFLHERIIFVVFLKYRGTNI